MSDETTAPATDDDRREPRETAPMSRFRATDVAVGLVVLAVGLVITVALPLAFTLG